MEKNNLDASQQTMSSLDIADATGKKHKHVMEAIRKMEAAWERVHGSKFRLMSRTIVIGNGAHRMVPCYELTKTECLYVATKFNDEARAKLILRWEELEKKEVRAFVPQVQPKTSAELMLMYAQQMVEQERRVQAIESKVEQTEQRIAEIEARTVTSLPYTTIVGFANRYGIRVPREKASLLGRVATNLCRQYGFEMGRVEDPRFGMVKTYPDGVLSETFAKYYPNITF